MFNSPVRPCQSNRGPERGERTMQGEINELLSASQFQMVILAYGGGWTGACKNQTTMALDLENFGW